MSTWLPESDWRLVQRSVPITCVDVVPVQRENGRIVRIGLIFRNTPHQGRRWCIVGGRLLRDEPMTVAATRQLHETLGPAVRFTLPADARPAVITQYFTDVRPGQMHDPRQHAVTLNFVVEVAGEVTPSGEAHDFRWFAADQLPPPDQFGFGQDAIVRACLDQPL